MKCDIKTAISLQFENITTASVFFNVNVSTIYRWIQRDNMPPQALNMLIEKSRMDLSAHGECWLNWIIKDGYLIAPNGAVLHVDQLDGLADWLKDQGKDITPQCIRFMRARYRHHHYKR